MYMSGTLVMISWTLVDRQLMQALGQVFANMSMSGGVNKDEDDI